MISAIMEVRKYIKLSEQTIYFLLPMMVETITLSDVRNGGTDE